MGSRWRMFRIVCCLCSCSAEAAYPYKGVNGKCQSSSCTPVANITGGAAVPSKNETALMAAIANQPTSVSVCAAGNNWYVLNAVHCSKTNNCVATSRATSSRHLIFTRLSLSRSRKCAARRQFYSGGTSRPFMAPPPRQAGAFWFTHMVLK